MRRVVQDSGHDAAVHLGAQLRQGCHSRASEVSVNCPRAERSTRPVHCAMRVVVVIASDRMSRGGARWGAVAALLVAGCVDVLGIEHLPPARTESGPGPEPADPDGGSQTCSDANQGAGCDPGTEQCVQGECACQAPLVRCDGTCIDPGSNALFCGASQSCSDAERGASCDPSTETCVGGQCACKAPLVRCDGACIDPASNALFCGASQTCSGAEKGASCDPGTETCVQGQCACNPPLVRCDGICIDPLVDNLHCGAQGTCDGAQAGMACPPLAPCGDGICGKPFQVGCFPLDIGNTNHAATDMARDLEGNLYFHQAWSPGDVNHVILKMMRTTCEVWTVAHLPDGTHSRFLGIAYHPSQDRLFVGTTSSPLAGGDALVIAVDPQTGDWQSHCQLAGIPGSVNTLDVVPTGIHAGKLAIGVKNQIYLVDPVDGDNYSPISPLPLPVVSVSDLVFGSDGSLYAVSWWDGILKINVDNGQWTWVTDQVKGDGIEIDESHHRLLVSTTPQMNDLNGTDPLYAVDLVDPMHPHTEIAQFDFDWGSFPSGLVFDDVSTLALVTKSNTGTLRLEALTLGPP